MGKGPSQGRRVVPARSCDILARSGVPLVADRELHRGARETLPVHELTLSAAGITLLTGGCRFVRRRKTLRVDKMTLAETKKTLRVDKTMLAQTKKTLLVDKMMLAQAKRTPHVDEMMLAQAVKTLRVDKTMRPQTNETLLVDKTLLA
jgi:hypothetical protein